MPASVTGAHDDEGILRQEVLHVLSGRRGGDKQGPRFGLVIERAVGDHRSCVGQAGEVPLMLLQEARAQRFPGVEGVMDDPQRHETILSGRNRSRLMTVVPGGSNTVIRTRVRHTSRRVAV